MAVFTDILHTAFLVLVILLAFNLLIFVHELGHFLAGRWRGLKIDRFQIWFGKPIWKKTYNGVQYGLGWLPFGGFVSLPQMAPMESIEGSRADGDEPLPKISPLDKIIVAFAGPLFSMLLALAAACIVWGIGKPTDMIPSTTVGSVFEDSPAYKAGIRTGDKILKVNDVPVEVFAGSPQMRGIFEQIVLSKGQEIRFTVERAGEPAPLELTSKFDIPDTKWFQRKALRQVGIGPEAKSVYIGAVTEGSPAERAGLKKGDRLITIDGKPVVCGSRFVELVKGAGTRPFEIVFERSSAPEDAEPEVLAAASSEEKKVTVQALVPVSPAGKPAMIGVVPSDAPVQTSITTHPGPWQQIRESLTMMVTTLDRLISKDSSINVSHLSGAVGIMKMQYHQLQQEAPLNRILALFVLINVNLAILNMLPLPVLDGGHILMATMEAVLRRPVKARLLEWVQTAFALMLISLMLYVTSKDLFGDIGGRDEMEKIVWPE